MNTPVDESGATIDPAAVLGAAISLWQSCQRPRGGTEPIDFSVSYCGGDQWMREVMRVATLFEAWATRHVCFDEFGECWPYFLEDCFGDACVELVGADGLARFCEEDCLRVALRLRLPVIGFGVVVVPLDLTAANPVAGSGFTHFRIQTMRRSPENAGVVPMTLADDSFGADFGPPLVALYGVRLDGRLEHIADRRNYAQARELAVQLAPGIAFTEVAVVTFPTIC